MNELYMDVNGSTPVHPEVARAAAEAMATMPANPSAGHPEGRRARAAIERARARVADAIGATPEQILFTSGGTESNNWAAFSAAQRSAGGHVLVSGIEHKSVLEAARALARQGIEVTELAPTAGGRVRVRDIEGALRPDTFWVSIMLANNETGILQPVEEIAELCRTRGVSFHTDAVTALGKVPIEVQRIGCDSLSLSAHKMYAPKGVGVLYLRDPGAAVPWMLGCGQQGGLRSGTENTSGAVAFGVAMDLMQAGHFGSAESVGAMRDELWRGLESCFPGLQRNGEGPCLPGTLNVAFPGNPAHELQEGLAAAGISVGVGASGSSGQPSHVLAGMGLDVERARSSLRFSLGHATTFAAVARVVEVLANLLSVPGSSKLQS